MMNSNKKHFLSFTLIEIVLVTVLLCVIASVIGASVSYVLRYERGRSDIELLAEKVQLAEDFMSTLNVNVILEITREDKGFQGQLYIDNEDYLERLGTIITKPFKLRNIKEIEFYPIGDDEASRYDKCVLEFLSGGAKVPHGNLKITATGSKSYLYFGGSVGKILLSDIPVVVMNPSDDSQELFPYEIFD